MTEIRPKSAEWQELLNYLAILMNEGSPVAMPILAGAMLEDQVSRTIDRMMPKFRKLAGAKDIDHSLRVSILCGMGVVSESIAEALRAFANIRNKFAHEPHKHTFESQNVAAFAKNLEKALRTESASEWEKFGDRLQDVLKRKAAAAGGRLKLEHPVGLTMISAFMMLMFYMIWARHHAPIAKAPRPFEKLAQQ